MRDQYGGKHLDRNTRYLTSAAFLLFTLYPTLSTAQTVEGRVNGTVTDSSGNVVANTQISLRNLDTNAERQATSSETGNYVVPSVPPGRYTLIATLPGFQRYVVPEFRLQVNESRTVDVQLSVGEVTQSVEVSA